MNDNLFTIARIANVGIEKYPDYRPSIHRHIGGREMEIRIEFEEFMAIGMAYRHMCEVEDVLSELDCLGYDVDAIPSDIVELVVSRYSKYRDNDEGFVYDIQEAIEYCSDELADYRASEREVHSEEGDSDEE